MAPRSSPRRRWLRVLLFTLLVLVAIPVVGSAVLWLLARESLGGRVEGARRTAAEQSPQWQAGEFTNRLARIDRAGANLIQKFFFDDARYRTPDAPIPVVARRSADYATPPASGLRVTWLGHSTMLLEIDGRRVLIDPVWGDRASPFTFIGPKRFFAPPLPLAELPSVDAVIISHDHYDHLDLPTVKALLARRVRWIVPLGVGAHLEQWGVAAGDITELDWWGAAQVEGLTITATPARHFSGRGLTDADQTLWAGWSIAGTTHRVFYSGDTALHPEFAEIGRRLGPFDLTMMEAGAYSALWADVHLGPEQAVMAHKLVRGRVMLPVHWGLFDLALHGWTEPMERSIAAAESAGVRVAAPRPGDWFEPATLEPVVRWWPRVPWETAQVAPAWSSGVDEVREQARAMTRDP